MSSSILTVLRARPTAASSGAADVFPSGGFFSTGFSSDQPSVARPITTATAAPSSMRSFMMFPFRLMSEFTGFNHPIARLYRSPVRSAPRQLRELARGRRDLLQCHRVEVFHLQPLRLRKHAQQSTEGLQHADVFRPHALQK